MAGQKKRAEDWLASEEEEEALGRVGLGRVPMDIPFAMDPVNVVIVEGDGVALIDAGMRQEGNWERLEGELKRRGYGWKDLKEVYLTHPHLDHFGLAGSVAEKTGAKVFCWKPSIERFEKYQETWVTDRAGFVGFLQESGVEASVIEGFRKIPSQYAQTAGPVVIDRGFEEGEEVVMVGRHKVKPVHVPGHSPWCTAFWFSESGVVVAGDAVLPRATSTPLWYPPQSVPSSWQGLGVYRTSLGRLAELPAVRVIPGHGASFEDLRGAISRALEHQVRRRGRIAGLFEERGEMTLWDATTRIFDPEMVKQAPYLVLSDISRQIDWLCEEGVLQRSEGTPGRYRRIGG